MIRLPYEQGAAPKLRKLALLDRVYPYFLPPYLVFLVWWLLRPPNASMWTVVPNLIIVVLALLGELWKVDPTPSRTRRGDLYLPGLPPAVAHRWLEANPGVRAVGRKPAYRRWPPAVYIAGSVACAAGVAATTRWMFSGTDVPLFVVLALIVGAVTFGYLALPTGHTRLDGKGSMP